MFDRQSINVDEKEWKDTERVYEILQELSSLKVEEIPVDGIFIKSKTAWKIAVLAQVYLRRLCELGESCVVAWNMKHYIAALTLARSILETGALLCNLDEVLQKTIQEKNIKFLDEHVMNLMFSSRIEEILGENEQLRSKNILTFISKKDKEIPGLRAVYEYLSECSHPNQLGCFQHYGEIDNKEYTARFSSGNNLEDKFELISCAFSFVLYGYNSFRLIQENIKKVTLL